MGQFTHEITVPGTNYRCYVNAEKMDLARIVRRVAAAKDKRRRDYAAPSVRLLDPGEAAALGGLPAVAPRNKFGYPVQ